MNSQEKIYLDYNATTPLWLNSGENLHGNVKFQDTNASVASPWGNPSSIHWASREAKVVLRQARQQLAEKLNCSPLEIIFNSGGSESNNTVLKTFLFQNLKNTLASKSPYGFEKNIRNKILISSVEHPSVLKAADFLSEYGFNVKKIPVNRSGELDLNFVKSELDSSLALVSVMYANNETGVIYNIKELTKLVHSVGAYMHTDAVQAFGKIPVDLKSLDVDYASFSLHKIYCAKGAGFLYVKKSAPFENLIHGGGQERHRRGGTENLYSLAYATKVLPDFKKILQQTTEIKILRDYFEQEILKQVSGVSITSQSQNRLPNTSHLMINGIDGEILLLSLDLEGFAVSTGAACSSGSPEPSPVLLNMGFDKHEAQKSLRVSLGALTTRAEVDKFIKVLVQTIQRLRDVSVEYEKKQQTLSSDFLSEEIKL